MDGITLFVVVACGVGVALGGAVQLAAFIHKKAVEEERKEALRQIEWVGVGCCEAMVPGKEANDGSARAVFSGVRVGSTVVGG